jgi:hypothetical protein
VLRHVFVEERRFWEGQDKAVQAVGLYVHGPHCALFPKSEGEYRSHLIATSHHLTPALHLSSPLPSPTTHLSLPHTYSLSAPFTSIVYGHIPIFAGRKSHSYSARHHNDHHGNSDGPRPLKSELCPEPDTDTKRTAEQDPRPSAVRHGCPNTLPTYAAAKTKSA